MRRRRRTRSFERVEPTLSSSELLALERILATRWPTHSARCGNAASATAARAVHGVAVAWAAGVALQRDAAALPRIVAMLTGDELDDDHHVWSDLFDSAACLAGDDPALRRHLHPLAAHGEGTARQHVAYWLDPEDPTEAALLERMLDDASRFVVDAARKALGDGAVAWWRGRFDVDPVAGMTEPELREHLPALQRYVAFEAEAGPHEREGERWALIAAMPPRAALAAARTRLVADLGVNEESAPHLVATFAGVPGGVAVMFDTVATITDPWFWETRLEKALVAYGEAHPERRQEIVEVAFERLRTRPGDYRDRTTRLLAHTCAALWPAERDVAPWMELSIAWGEAGDHGPALHGPVARAGDAPWTRPLFRELLGADLEGRLRYLRHDLTELAKGWPAPDRLALVDEVIERRPGRSALAWAVDTLRDVDPERLLRHYDDPEVHDQLFCQLRLTGPVMARARRDLVEGRLSLHDVGEVMNKLCHPHDAGTTFHRLMRYPVEAVLEPGPGQFEVAPGPEELAEAPPTDAEWAVLRAMRAGPVQDAFAANVVFPLGPWDPDDRAFYDRLVDAVLADPERAESTCACRLPLLKPDPGLVPQLRRLLASPNAELAEHAFEALELLLPQLGLPSEAPPRALADDDLDDDDTW